MEISNIYNPALVDVKQDDTFDDMSVSNNQDMETILATVIHTVILQKRNKIYEIHGIIDWVNEPFQGYKTYDAFLISLKNKLK